MSDLYRSTEVTTEGRTLTGVAIEWDRPGYVTDDGRTHYWEAFRSDSADKSITQRGVYPSFVNHDSRQLPIGSVTFARSDEGLVFELPLANTERGNEVLELVNSGAMRSVSIGFRPINQTTKRSNTNEDVVLRTEVALRELSVVPTGYGQREEATIAGVRSEHIEIVESATDEELELLALRMKLLKVR